jgi:hypothetical protein
VRPAHEFLDRELEVLLVAAIDRVRRHGPRVYEPALSVQPLSGASSG